MMTFGKIARSDSDITQSEWAAVIDSESSLSHMPDRQGVDPFTNETVVFPGEGKALYSKGGEVVGNAVLEEGVILTTGVPIDVCHRLAKLIAAEASEDDRS